MPDSQLFGLFSNTQGPDGNGLFNPSDPSLGGHGGTATTPASSTTAILASGGFVPTDQTVSVVEATVIMKTPQTGLPTAAGSFKLKGTFIRNGNTVTQQAGAGISSSAELPASLSGISCRLIVDGSKTPNEITVQVKPSGGAPALAWQWFAGVPTVMS